MQRIVVKNFQGIKEADVSISKVLIIIGEQASGKSTLAKLIYFFQTIQEDIFNLVFYDEKKLELQNGYDLEKFITNKFYNFFGSTQFWDAFEVSYSYGENKTISLSISEDNKMLHYQITASFEKAILQAYQDNINIPNIHKPFFLPVVQGLDNINQVHNSLSKIFSLRQTHTLYTIAGRNLTVSYSDLFKKYLFSNIEQSIEKNRTASPFSKTQNTDEILMLKFIEHVDGTLSNLGGGIKGIIQANPDNRTLLLADKKMQTILKGKYFNNNLGEHINVQGENKKNVLLKDASSGQQESIRILQDLFLIIEDGRPVMRIFEEPEAHLFPVAQKELIELMALMLNSVQNSSIIITTHSPYILSVFNNLLFASQVAAKHPDKKEAVKQVIQEEFWLQPEEVNAYSLGNSYDPEKNYFEDIFNEETGTIDQNYLDAVSEMLGEEFYKLIEINNQ